jgi:predicted dienelactone hydrolase
MTGTVACTLILMFAISGLSNPALAQNRIDTQRPDAPELAAYGQYAIGVRRIKIVNPQQIDIINIDPKTHTNDNLPSYNRPLTLEVWYPAVSESNGNTELDVYLRDGKTKIILHGKAVRDAQPLTSKHKFPLVIISHGYPGNRFLLSPLADNIASKGYVVVSIDHTDSTYRTLAAFGSTLVNRPLDQLFTLDQVEMMSQEKSSFLYNLVDANNSALIGYSMGAYGTVIMAGGGLSQNAIDSPIAPPFQTLDIHKSKSRLQQRFTDPRLKTIVAFAPWGMNHGVWDEDTLKSVTLPALFVAGSVDDVSGYETGVRSIWQATSNVDRSLLTFINANHSAGAPMPAPEESYVYDPKLGIHLSEHYTDVVWDNVRMNNVSQHFVTAWLGKYLQGKTDMDNYLNLTVDSNEGVWATDKAGKQTADHTYWTGFANRTAKGLKFETLNKGE